MTPINQFKLIKAATFVLQMQTVAYICNLDCHLIADK